MIKLLNFGIFKVGYVNNNISIKIMYILFNIQLIVKR